MKALNILLKLWYGSLISTQKWLSDRPKRGYSLVEAGLTQQYTRNQLFLKKDSIFLIQEIAQTLLFQMTYDSLINSKNWPSDISKASGIPNFRQSHTMKLLTQCQTTLFTT